MSDMYGFIKLVLENVRGTIRLIFYLWEKMFARVMVIATNWLKMEEYTEIANTYYVTQILQSVTVR